MPRAKIRNADIAADAAIASIKLASWSANRNAGGNQLVSLADGVGAQDAVTVAQLTAASPNIIAGEGLVRTGNTLDIIAGDDSIKVSTDDIKVADFGIKRVKLDFTTVGNSVIAKVIAGAAITISQTGADAGTGDVTIGITTGGVTLAMLANIATSTFIGRITAGSGPPEALTIAQAKTLLNLAGSNTGDQTITLSGDVAGSGTGAITATIQAGVVTYAKIQNVSTNNRLLGRSTAGAGSVEEITVGSGLTLSAGILTASSGSGTVTSVAVSGANGIGVSGSPITTSGTIALSLGAITPSSVASVGTVTGSNLSGTNTGDQTITLTGDVTGTGTSSFAATIATSAVTLAKMANVATATVFYRKTAGTGAPEVQTLATLKTDLGLTGTNSGDQTITLTGDVTGSGTGSFAATIANLAVTYAKIQNVSATNRLLGRSTAGAGSIEEITVGSGLSLSAGILTATGGGTVTDFSAGDLSPLFTTSEATTTTTPALTFTLSNAAANTFFGNGTGSSAPPTFMSASTARTALGLVIGTDVQAFDGTLAAFAALTIAPDSLTIGTGADAFSQTTFAANTFPARASTGNLVAKTITDFALTILDDADAATVRATIGAGTGSGTVTAVSIVTANGVSGSSSGGATPALTIVLGAITPSSVAATGTVTGSNLSGTNTGDQTITLTGDVTGSGTGSFAATIATSAVTLAKMADVATATVFYRKTAGTGAPEVQTLATLKTDLGLTGTNSGDQTITLTGDVTGTGTGSFATTIANSAVTMAKLANLAGWSVIGRASSTTGVPAAITGTVADQVLRINTSGTTLGFGTVATGGIADSAITLAKMANVATATVFYRKTAGTGDPEVQTLATLKTDLGLTGTNSGDQTITLTGDVTGTGTGSFAATIANDAVTFAKMQNIATATFIGRNTAATGDPESLTIATAKTMLNLSGTNTGDQTITLTGDVTGSGTGSFAATIAAGAVTFAKLATSAWSDDVTLAGDSSVKLVTEHAAKTYADSSILLAIQTTLASGTFSPTYTDISGTTSFIANDVRYFVILGVQVTVTGIVRVNFSSVAVPTLIEFSTDLPIPPSVPFSFETEVGGAGAAAAPSNVVGIPLKFSSIGGDVLARCQFVVGAGGGTAAVFSFSFTYLIA